MTGILRVPRRAALVTIAVLVAGASLVSFAESYHALYLWAARHGAGGNWALIWPAMVDVFIAVGELSLFVAMIDRWQPRDRALAWAVTLAGLATSVAGNVGHVASGAAADRVTAAVPPLAATAALAVGLGVLKRVARRAAPEIRHSVADLEPAPAVPGVHLNGSGLHPAETEPFAGELARGEVPSLRRIRAELHCGQPKAQEIQARLAVLAGGA